MALYIVDQGEAKEYSREELDLHYLGGFLTDWGIYEADGLDHALRVAQRDADNSNRKAFYVGWDSVYTKHEKTVLDMWANGVEPKNIRDYIHTHVHQMASRGGGSGKVK